MSTRANILLKHENGFKLIFVHWDGYLERYGLGYELMLGLRTPELLKDLGYIDSVSNGIIYPSSTDFREDDHNDSEFSSEFDLTGTLLRQGKFSFFEEYLYVYDLSDHSVWFCNHKDALENREQKRDGNYVFTNLPRYRDFCTPVKRAVHEVMKSKGEEHILTRDLERGNNFSERANCIFRCANGFYLFDLLGGSARPEVFGPSLFEGRTDRLLEKRGNSYKFRIGSVRNETTVKREIGFIRSRTGWRCWPEKSGYFLDHYWFKKPVALDDYLAMSDVEKIGCNYLGIIL